MTIFKNQSFLESNKENIRDVNEFFINKKIFTSVKNAKKENNKN